MLNKIKYNMNNANIYKHIIFILAIYPIIKILTINSRQLVPITIITILLVSMLLRVLLNKTKLKIPFDNRLQSLIFIYYLIWQFIVVIRGYYTNFETFDQLMYNVFLNQFSFLAYTIPLYLFLGFKNFDFIYLIKVCVIMNFIFIIYAFLSFEDIFLVKYSFSDDENYGYGKIANITTNIVSLYKLTAFVLLIPTFVSKKIWKLNFICWCFALVIIMVGARRSIILSLILTGLAAFIFYIKQNNGGSTKRIALIIIFIIGSITVVSNNMNNSFHLLEKRAMENTRKGVEEQMINDVFKKSDDWIWGRGMGGKYNSLLHPEYSNPPRRSSMETGYLFIILQGGVISLGLYLLLLISAAIKGIFYSKNKFIKAFAVYIIISIIELYPFGIPSFNLSFLIIWIGVAMCSSKTIRNLSDEEIKNIFFKNNENSLDNKHTTTANM